MNEISTRLFSAIQKPVALNQRQSYSFHASSASIKIPDGLGGQSTVGSCLRQQFYRITGVAPTNTGELDWSISANIGDKLHELALELLDANGFQMGMQVLKAEHAFFDPRINMSARSDILIWDHRNNCVAGVEVKSVGEYKAGKCLVAPSPEHVLQSILYLDYYQTFIPEGMTAPTKWYIWYISRAENWTIKGKKHGSPFAMMWDFYVTLEGEERSPVIHSSEGISKWSDYTIPKIHERYHDLSGYLERKEIPKRDYELQYPEEKILGLYERDKLVFKKHKEPVAKWIKKGCPEGKLKLEMGDFECRVCAWQNHCWNFQTDSISENILFNLPKDQEKSTSPTPDPVL